VALSRDIGAFLNKELDHRFTAIPASIVEGSIAFTVLDYDICTLFDPKLGGHFMAEFTDFMKWSTP
jgi:hypothetical protein